MRNGVRVLGLFAGIGLILLSTTVTRADTLTQLTTEFVCTGAGCDSATWSTINGSTPTVGLAFSSPATSVTANNKSIGISSSGASIPLVIYNQGVSPWTVGANGFPPNENLLATDNPGHALDTLTLSFTGASLSEFGVYIQDYTGNASFTAEIIAVNGSTLGSPMQYTSTGAPVFVGIEDLCGATLCANITSLTFDVVNSGTDHYFALGPASLNEGTTTEPPVPEPGSILMMATGLAAVIWKVRRARA